MAQGQHPLVILKKKKKKLHANATGVVMYLPSVMSPSQNAMYKQ